MKFLSGGTLCSSEGNEATPNATLLNGISGKIPANQTGKRMTHPVTGNTDSTKW